MLLYEKDKVFTLQYIATERGSKIIYRGVLDEKQRSQAAMKRKCPKFVCDKMVPLINVSILMKTVSMETEGKQMRIEVRKEKWKYSTLMEFGTGDGYLLNREIDCAIL